MQKSIPYLCPRWRQNGYNRYPSYDQNGWKTIPFGAAHTYIAHEREYPHPGRKSVAVSQYNPELGVTLLKIKTLMSTIFFILFFRNTWTLRACAIFWLDNKNLKLYEGFNEDLPKQARAPLTVRKLSIERKDMINSPFLHEALYHDWVLFIRSVHQYSKFTLQYRHSLLYMPSNLTK